MAKIKKIRAHVQSKPLSALIFYFLFLQYFTYFLPFPKKFPKNPGKVIGCKELNKTFIEKGICTSSGCRNYSVMSAADKARHYRLKEEKEELREKKPQMIKHQD